QSAPPVPTASSRFHFPPLDSHSPTPEGSSLLAPSHPEGLGDGDRKAEVTELEDGTSDWRRSVDLLPPHGGGGSSGGGGGGGAMSHGKRKPDIVLPLFSRPALYPDPHSPFAVSPLPPGRGGSSGGVLNVPLSPALSLTPTLFSYSPSPGLSPFTGSSCFSFNPEEMKHYLHSQACSVFNYHLSPRTFPRYPLMVPPLQCQVPLEEQQPQFPIKLQPPPVGRKNRERNEDAAPLRVKLEPPGDKEEALEKGKEAAAGAGGGGGGDREANPGMEEEKEPVFARPAAPPSWPAASGISSSSSSSSSSLEEAAEPGLEKGGSAGEGGAQEKKEDALMPPKLRLKRRWNG
ncbi:ETV3 protein, partial [Neodrepanis coruscans]|nr:ETV3 protein [Neodrepanis coruscans]